MEREDFPLSGPEPIILNDAVVPLYEITDASGNAIVIAGNAASCSAVIRGTEGLLQCIAEPDHGIGHLWNSEVLKGTEMGWWTHVWRARREALVKISTLNKPS